MSLQRHPLAYPSSSYNGAVDSSQSSHILGNGGPSSGSGFLTPTAGLSRSPSPGVMARRRRGDSSAPTLEGTNVNTSQRDDYDPKRRPTDAAGSSRTVTTPYSTLDRLESFFGIESTAMLQSSSISSPSTSSTSLTRPETPTRSNSRSKLVNRQPGTRLGLQHTVLGTDTLQGIALRYKTDIPTLRKVNGLWPGDSVLTRKVLWVPLDRCKELGMNAEATLGIQGTDGGRVTETSLAGLSFGGPGSATGSTTPGSSNALHDRAISSTAASETSDPPSSNISSSSPPVVRRLPSEVLGHFPATPRSEILAKGKGRADQWNEELTSARPSHKLGPGPGMSGFDPGESGVEDLLQLAREARTSGSNDDASPMKDRSSSQRMSPSQSRSSTLRPSLIAEGEEESIRPDESRSEASAADEEWKPNVWHFGQKGKGGPGDTAGVDSRGSMDSNGPTATNNSAVSGPNATSSSRNQPRNLVDKSIQEWEASSSTLNPSKASSEISEDPSSYNGWNDVPTLEAYAKGRVVEAYGGGKGSSGGSGGSKSKRPARAHHRFFDDLAAGLPANTGAASKWARPIGDSVPMPGSSGQRPQASSRSQQNVGAPGTGKKSSFRALLNDTLRGRVALDEALAKGFEEVMNRSEGWNSLPQEEMEHARRLGVLPPPPNSLRSDPRRQYLYDGQSGKGTPPRISAEEARRTLSGSELPTASTFAAAHVNANAPSPAHGESLQTPAVERRKSQHEMQSLISTSSTPSRDQSPLQSYTSLQEDPYAANGKSTHLTTPDPSPRGGPRRGPVRRKSNLGSGAGNGDANDGSKWGW